MAKREGRSGLLPEKTNWIWESRRGIKQTGISSNSTSLISSQQPSNLLSTKYQPFNYQTTLNKISAFQLPNFQQSNHHPSHQHVYEDSSHRCRCCSLCRPSYRYLRQPQYVLNLPKRKPQLTLASITADACNCPQNCKHKVGTECSYFAAGNVEDGSKSLQKRDV